MLFWNEFVYAIQNFVDTGGDVLVIIGLIILVMWLLVLERFMFLFINYRPMRKQLISTWFARSDRNSWNAEQIRQASISRLGLKLNQHLPMISMLVAVCPLLGLLGTVTGMIEVFNVMAITGTGSARSMASGVSKATIPTMAGMVGALSGVFALSYLQRKTKREVELLNDKLVLDH